jgi:hypothetical protein
MTNRLSREKSPYLLQHAGNPVDWYPWGEEAFDRARRMDKPVFLSIGYSTCHWCHVMARESFQDQEVAELMNQVFVCVKVDREERPDIDEIYMRVCHMLTGSGGWPLTIVMTPDKKPFFAGTYLPKKGRFGRIGVVELTLAVKELWENRREEAVTSAEKIAGALRTVEAADPGPEPGGETLDRAFHALTERYDAEYGGIGDAPKFPMVPSLFFLLRYWKRRENPEALEMAARTLREMRMGGIYDHVGYGFHRYATDRRWLVPHFEKMLYDQALLAIAYIEAYQATGDEDMGRTAREILEYVLRDMRSPEGGFYSAEDAESGGEEGGFYLWRLHEVYGVLGREDGELVAEAYGLREEGNYLDEATRRKTGRNILHLRKPLSRTASEAGLREGDLRRRLQAALRKLFTAREARTRPGKDDKVLADWNGLMIAALARAGQVFEDQVYVEAAEEAAGFILENMTTEDGRLLHRYREGDAAIPGYLDDYAYLTWGLLELYEATFRWDYVKQALRLNEVLLRHFWDHELGGFFFTPDDGEELLMRRKTAHDGSLPSGNSVALHNLLRLARLTADNRLEEMAADLARAFSRDVAGFPMGHLHLLGAVDFALGPTCEVVIAGAGDGGEEARRMLRALRSRYLPRKVVVLLGEEKEELPPLLAELTGRGRETVAYVCRGYACGRPVKTAEELMSLLD